MRLLGSTGGWCEVKLISGYNGQNHTILEFWVDAAPSESTGGGSFNYEDWEFLLKHEINFDIRGSGDSNFAAITFSDEIDDVIGKIDLIGSWPLNRVEEAHSTCQWM